MCMCGILYTNATCSVIYLYALWLNLREVMENVENFTIRYDGDEECGVVC